MKKYTLLIILVSAIACKSNAQTKLSDFGRIVLNTYLPDNISIPNEAKGLLTTKLNQIASNNGMGGGSINSRFIITATLNIGTKDIISGAPQMIAQNLDITLFVGDASSNIIFSNTTITLKGVGANENKAFIDAFKTINPKNKEVVACLEEGKKKIIAYYSSQCNFIIKEALTLVEQEKYDEAIYKLSLVPEVCQDCYFKCLDTLANVYQKKIDADCKIKLSKAKATWAAAQDPSGAEKAGNIISTISPMSTCQSDVNELINNISSKLKEDEKEKWQFKMKQYADKITAQKEQIRIVEEKWKLDDAYREKQSSRNYELDKIRANSYREIAVQQAKNQPKIIYTNIFKK